MNRFFFVIVIPFLMAGCSSEVDVNAPWTDNTVVYGLLNKNDSIHYIRIQKSFLGEGNAYDMAAEPDSLYYNDIQITLERWKDGNNTGENIVFQSNSEIIKEDGTFASQGHIVYEAAAKIFANSNYKLNIYIPKRDKWVSSTTPVIDTLVLLENFEDDRTKISFANYSQPYEITWRLEEHARLYDVTILFHYTEILDNTETQKSLEWNLPSIEINGEIDNFTYTDKKIMKISGEAFYKYLAAKIDPVQNIQRYADSLDFHFILGGNALSMFMEVYKPSEGVVQEKPLYTNITNGIGFFSTRYDKIVTGKILEPYSIDTLSRGIYTKNLRFADRYGNFEDL